MLADREQTNRGGDVLLEVGEDADEIVVPLVGRDASHEEEVGPGIGEALPQRGTPPLAIALEIHGDGENAGPLEPARRELGAVELAVPQGQGGRWSERLK